MTTSILDRLRTETRTAHTELEECVCIHHRLESAAAYAELLERFLGFYRPLEPKVFGLASAAEWGFDPELRRKTPWLEQDLAALGYSKAEIAALPNCESLPALANLPAAFGCAYVIEGSTLGGRHISALLNRSPIPVNARNFFASYGSAVGERWKEFVTCLERFATANAGSDEIVHAAKDTFACMKDWVCKTAGAPR